MVDVEDNLSDREQAMVRQLAAACSLDLRFGTDVGNSHGLVAATRRVMRYVAINCASKRVLGGDNTVLVINMPQTGALNAYAKFCGLILQHCYLGKTAHVQRRASAGGAVTWDVNRLCSEIVGSRYACVLWEDDICNSLSNLEAALAIVKEGIPILAWGLFPHALAMAGQICYNKCVRVYPYVENTQFGPLARTCLSIAEGDHHRVIEEFCPMWLADGVWSGDESNNFGCLVNTDGRFVQSKPVVTTFMRYGCHELTLVELVKTRDTILSEPFCFSMTGKETRKSVLGATIGGLLPSQAIEPTLSYFLSRDGVPQPHAVMRTLIENNKVIGRERDVLTDVGVQLVCNKLADVKVTMAEGWAEAMPGFLIARETVKNGRAVLHRWRDIVGRVCIEELVFLCIIFLARWRLGVAYRNFFGAPTSKVAEARMKTVCGFFASVISLIPRNLLWMHEGVPSGQRSIGMFVVALFQNGIVYPNGRKTTSALALTALHAIFNLVATRYGLKRFGDNKLGEAKSAVYLKPSCIAHGGVYTPKVGAEVLNTAIAKAGKTCHHNMVGHPNMLYVVPKAVPTWYKSCPCNLLGAVGRLKTIKPEMGVGALHGLSAYLASFYDKVNRVLHARGSGNASDNMQDWFNLEDLDSYDRPLYTFDDYMAMRPFSRGKILQEEAADQATGKAKLPKTYQPFVKGEFVLGAKRPRPIVPMPALYQLALAVANLNIGKAVARVLSWGQEVRWSGITCTIIYTVGLNGDQVAAELGAALRRNHATIFVNGDDLLIHNPFGECRWLEADGESFESMLPDVALKWERRELEFFFKHFGGLIPLEYVESYKEAIEYTCPQSAPLHYRVTGDGFKVVVEIDHLVRFSGSGTTSWGNSAMSSYNGLVIHSLMRRAKIEDLPAALEKASEATGMRFTGNGSNLHSQVTYLSCFLARAQTQGREETIHLVPKLGMLAKLFYQKTRVSTAGGKSPEPYCAWARGVILGLARYADLPFFKEVFGLVRNLPGTKIIPQEVVSDHKTGEKLQAGEAFFEDIQDRYNITQEDYRSWAASLFQAKGLIRDDHYIWDRIIQVDIERVREGEFDDSWDAAWC